MSLVTRMDEKPDVVNILHCSSGFLKYLYQLTGTCCETPLLLNYLGRSVSQLMIFYYRHRICNTTNCTARYPLHSTTVDGALFNSICLDPGWSPRCHCPEQNWHGYCQKRRSFFLSNLHSRFAGAFYFSISPSLTKPIPIYFTTPVSLPIVRISVKWKLTRSY